MADIHEALHDRRGVMEYLHYQIDIDGIHPQDQSWAERMQTSCTESICKKLPRSRGRSLDCIYDRLLASLKQMTHVYGYTMNIGQVGGCQDI